MGYHVHSGGKWSGDHLVVDAEMYAAHAEEFSAHVHHVKEVVFVENFNFPVHGGTIVALPTHQQEGRRVLGESERNESLDKPIWDHPTDEGTLLGDNDGAYNRGGSSASSGGPQTAETLRSSNRTKGDAPYQIQTSTTIGT